MNSTDLLVGVYKAYNFVPKTRMELWEDWLEECDRRMETGDGVLRPRMPFDEDWDTMRGMWGD